MLWCGGLCIYAQLHTRQRCNDAFQFYRKFIAIFCVYIACRFCVGVEAIHLTHSPDKAKTPQRCEAPICLSKLSRRKWVVTLSAIPVSPIHWAVSIVSRQHDLKVCFRSQTTHTTHTFTIIEFTAFFCLFSGWMWEQKFVFIRSSFN